MQLTSEHTHHSSPVYIKFQLTMKLEAVSLLKVKKTPHFSFDRDTSVNIINNKLAKYQDFTSSLLNVRGGEMPAEAKPWGDVAVLIFARDQTRMEDNLGLPKKNSKRKRGINLNTTNPSS